MLASSSGGVGGRLVGSALHNSSNAFVTMETGVFKATIDAIKTCLGTSRTWWKKLFPSSRSFL